MSEADGGVLSRIPVIVRAIVGGLLVGMIPANVWLVLLVILKLPVLQAVAAELVFLVIYVWWARGGGPPASFREKRRDYFRVRSLSGARNVRLAQVCAHFLSG